MYTNNIFGEEIDLHSTSVHSFYIDVVLTLSIEINEPQF